MAVNVKAIFRCPRGYSDDERRARLHHQHGFCQFRKWAEAAAYCAWAVVLLTKAMAIDHGRRRSA